MDRLRSMEAFVAVVDYGSFVSAANVLDMSKVMVTKHIAELEKRLGTRLLNRTTRNLSLTEIGENYCQQCRQILDMIKKAETSTEIMHSVVRGKLKISAPVAFGSECLAPALADYLCVYPEVNIDLDLSNRNADFVEEGLDAAIRIGHLSDSNLIARQLKSYGTAICASPDYLRRFGTPKHPNDLTHHQCLDYAHWTSQSRWKFDEKYSTVSESRMRSNNGLALKQAALAGVGIMMQAEILVAKEIADGRLVEILKEFWPEPRPMHLIYQRDRQTSRKLSSFIEFVMQRFRLD